MAEKNSGFTFDTCVGIRICENPNVASLLDCRIGLGGSTVHLNTQFEDELARSHHDLAQASRQIESTGARIVWGEVTAEMGARADDLESWCDTLHRGDSQILAYAEATGTVLVTADRGLAKAARSIRVAVVNPDLLPCDESAKKARSRFGHLVRKMRPAAKKRNVGRAAARPGRRMTRHQYLQTSANGSCLVLDSYSNRGEEF